MWHDMVTARAREVLRLFGAGCFWAMAGLLIPGCAGSRTVVASAPAAAEARPWLDPTAQTPEAEIYRTWVAYLSSKSRGLSDCVTGSPHWLRSEVEQMHCYDLAGAFLDFRGSPDVIGIRASEPADSEYEVTTRFPYAGGAPAPTWYAAPMTTTVYAVRDGDRSLPWCGQGAAGKPLGGDRARLP